MKQAGAGRKPRIFVAAGNISPQPGPLVVLACEGHPRSALTEARGLSSRVSHKLELTPPAESEAYFPLHFWESHSHIPILAAKSYSHWGTEKGRWVGPQ